MTTQMPATPQSRSIESHTTHSERLMKHAYEQLTKGDRLQASEKAWGAVVHQFKALADQRGLTYDKHDHLYPIVEQVAREAGRDREKVKLLFAVAEGLHKNYYVDVQSIAQLKFSLSQARKLVKMLNSRKFMHPNGRPLSVRGKAIGQVAKQA